MASSKQLVVVLGATGKQGGSVVCSLEKTNKYQIRGVTRQMNSECSKKLQNKGVEMIEANTEDCESLCKAFKNAYAVFAVTDFWEKEVGEKEFEHGKNIVDAAKKCNVEHFIYSSLPNVEKLSGGKRKVPHFTLKAKVEEYARSAGLKHVYFLSPAAYYQNFLNMWKPKAGPKGELMFNIPSNPNTYLSLYNICDIGDAFVSLLENPKQWEGKCIPLVGEQVKIDEVFRILTDAIGQKAINQPSDIEQMKSQNAEMYEMVKWFEEYGYFGPKADLDIGKKLHKPTSLRDWAEQHANELKQAISSH